MAGVFLMMSLEWIYCEKIKNFLLSCFQSYKAKWDWVGTRRNRIPEMNSWCSHVFAKTVGGLI